MIVTFNNHSTRPTMPVAPDIKALQDSIFWSKVERAKQTPLEEKFLDGPRLFDEMSRWTKACIRGEHPEFTDEQVQQEFLRRLAIRKRLDDAGFYQDAGFIDDE